MCVRVCVCVCVCVRARAHVIVFDLGELCRGLIPQVDGVVEQTVDEAREHLLVPKEASEDLVCMYVYVCVCVL